MKSLVWLCAAFVFLAPVAAAEYPDPVAALNANSEKLLLSHRFDALDALADNFRRSDAHLPGGHSTLYHFYRDLGSFSGAGCGCNGDGTKVAFSQKQQAVDAWLAERPRSPAAQIVKAQLLINEAWVARTEGYADKITGDQWELFRARLREAGAWLDKLHPNDDPYIYAEQMQIALAEPDARARLDALYAEAVRTFPRFFHYYADRADRLQTKWFGKPDELAAYTRSLANTPGGDDGEIAYAFAAGRLAGQNLYTSGFLFRGTGLTWAAVQKAYSVREQRYGLTSGDWNTLLFFAVTANDSRKGSEIVKHIGNDWAKAYWGTASGYAAIVKWARAPDHAPNAMPR